MLGNESSRLSKSYCWNETYQWYLENQRGIMYQAAQVNQLQKMNQINRVKPL